MFQWKQQRRSLGLDYYRLRRICGREITAKRTGIRAFIIEGIKSGKILENYHNNTKDTKILNNPSMNITKFELLNYNSKPLLLA